MGILNTGGYLVRAPHGHGLQAGKDLPALLVWPKSHVVFPPPVLRLVWDTSNCPSPPLFFCWMRSAFSRGGGCGGGGFQGNRRVTRASYYPFVLFGRVPHLARLLLFAPLFVLVVTFRIFARGSGCGGGGGDDDGYGGLTGDGWTQLGI